LAKAAGVPKGSGTPNTTKVGKISQAQLKVPFSALLTCTSADRSHSRLFHMEGAILNITWI